jgi:hypothetical protein
VQGDFIVETIPAIRKTQSFLDFIQNCYFVPALDISAFKRSIRSILRVECSARRLQRRNNPATRKTHSFADFDENCYFFPD